MEAVVRADRAERVRGGRVYARARSRRPFSGVIRDSRRLLFSSCSSFPPTPLLTPAPSLLAVFFFLYTATSKPFCFIPFSLPLGVISVHSLFYS